jgi:xylulokinase
MARSAMEGVTMGMNYGFNRLRRLGIEPVEVRLTGGGARNRAWRRIAADVFDVEVVTLRVEEGAAYGAAIQAIWAYQKHVGEPVSIRELTDRFVAVNESSRLGPNPENVEVYRRLQGLQDRLSLDLRGAFRAHKSL